MSDGLSEGLAVALAIGGLAVWGAIVWEAGASWWAARRQNVGRHDGNE